MSSGCPHRSFGDQPVGDSSIVDLAHAGGHVRADDAGSDFVDRNAVAASRTAKSFAVIARPALLTQYSPRFGDAISADTDVTKTMPARKLVSAALPRDHVARDRLRQEVRARRFVRIELLEALFRRPRADRRARAGAAGVVDERIDAAVSRVRSRRPERARASAARMSETQVWSRARRLTRDR